ncbi:integrin alpha-L-like [Engraulis encrasicolus]|uniref:integrin alpha-L-like n=1 Tax=Engraulis encrasicolus TaxID=184585 RepID=UPI002FCFBD9A
MMAAWGLYLHLVVLCATVYQSVANSVDLEQAVIFNGTGPREDFFGYKVHLFQSGTKKGIVVSAPLLNNGSGGIFMCNHTSSHCEPFPLPEASVANEETDFVKAVGMTVAVRTKPSLQFTACSPAWAHECDGTPYYNSICYQWGNAEPVSNFTSAFKECTKQDVDLVFIFDGSLSMKDEEFNKNKDFIAAVMKSMENTSIQFAAAQFSSSVRTVFTFNDFREKRALQKLKNESHMKSLTNTHKAMRFALEKLFENQTSGCQPKATKVLVIITDGNPSDRGEAIIKIYEDNHIIRFVIAVGNDINMAVLRKLASDSSIVFFIQDYAGLSGLLKDLETNFLNIEGSSDHFRPVQVFENECSQSGMSAAYAEDSLVVGSVGSHNSRGSLHEITASSLPDLEIKDPDMEEFAYMGYTVAVGKKNGIAMYFAGAPRYKHKGQVIVFSQVESNWSVIQRLESEQIGSYFGGELCAVDIDSDGTTDFLMVGAPLYYHPQIEGLMYVYALAEQNMLKKVQIRSASPQGRFSSSIASLRDLNGDGLQDLAVGAPLEDDRRGVVYIYLGHGTKGIRSDYYQRIRARSLSESLRQFGVSIDGTSDTDGLTDIVVGSYGQVVLLKSRPVFSVSAHLSFSPSEISILQLDCTEEGETLPMVNLTLCFRMSEQTNSTTDRMATGLKLKYDLDVDQERQRSRAFFAANDSSLRYTQTIVHLNSPSTCSIHAMFMLRCVRDTIAPIIIKMNFSQADNRQPYGVLNVDTKTEAMVMVPFQTPCGGNDTCVADLKLDFNFTSAAMVVFADQYLSVKLVLSNEGDDSYNTSLRFQHPEGLSPSKIDVIKPKKNPLTNCTESKDALDVTVCDVSSPIFRRKNWVVLIVSFYIEASLKWSDVITLTITAHSDNGDRGNGTMGSTFKNYPVTKSLPVVLPVQLEVTFWDAPGTSTTFVPFSIEDKGPKTLNHMYWVANTGRVPLPVTVSFIFPTKPEEDFRITHPRITNNEVAKGSMHCTDPHSIVTQSCSRSQGCLRIRCSIPTLNSTESVLFTLSVKASISLSLNEYTFSEQRLQRTFTTFAEIGYNTTRYIQFGYDQKKLDNFPWQQGKTAAEYIVPIHLPMPIGIACFGGLLLLIAILLALYKVNDMHKSLKLLQQLNNTPTNKHLAEDCVDGALMNKNYRDLLEEDAQHMEDAPLGAPSPFFSPSQAVDDAERPPLNLSMTAAEAKQSLHSKTRAPPTDWSEKKRLFRNY